MSKTHAKSHPLLHPAASGHPKTRNGVHFADFVPQGLPKLWTHSIINIRHFIKDYSLAVSLTVIFLVLVVAASWLRLSQQASLANLLASASSITQDITSLVSNDKSSAPSRSDVQDDVARAPAGSSGSFAINSTGTGQTTGGGTSGGSGGTGGGSSGGGSTGGGGTTTPPPVFSASIAAFQQDSVALECTKPTPKPQFCSKRYTFSASVNTINGPGAVNYGWRSNVSGANEDSSYTAASGSSQNTLQKSVVISCLSSGSYSMQFVLFSPSQVQSTTLAINHNCVGI